MPCHYRSWQCYKFGSHRHPPRHVEVLRMYVVVHTSVEYLVSVNGKNRSDIFQDFWECSNFLIVNPRSAGEWVNINPLPYFLDSSKTTADIDAKLLVPYPASIWRRLAKFRKKSVEFFFRKWRFSNVIFRDFGSKSRKCLQTSRMCTFRVKHNP